MSDNSNDCAICYKKHVTNPATHWCTDCDHSYCADCEINHGLIKALKHHQTIPIKDYLDLKDSFDMVESTCRIHNERFHLFCQVHDALLCPECVENHARCEKVTSLSKLTKNIKESELAKDAQAALNDNIHNISILHQCLNEGVQKIGDKTTVLKKEVSLMRKTIDDHLDKLEKSINDDIDSLGSQLKSKTVKDLSKISDKKRETTLLQKQLQDVLKFGNETQIYFCLRDIGNKINLDEQFINSCSEGNAVTLLIPNVKVNAKVREITGIKKFGEVCEESLTETIHLKQSKAKQAQIAESPRRSIFDLKAVFVRSIDSKGNDVTGCTVLPDGRFVLSNFSRPPRLTVIDEQSGNSEVMLTDYEKITDVVHLDGPRVAVSCNGYVLIVDMNTKVICSTIQINGNVYGLVNMSSSLVCLTSQDIKFLNVEKSNITRSLKQFYVYGISYITEFGDYLYVTNAYANNNVKRINKEGTTLWTFRDTTVLKNPWGIAVDHHGNVYVACRGHSHVIVISPDGKNSKVLISKSCGINEPTGVHYDKKTNQLLVCNNKDKCFEFKIS